MRCVFILSILVSCSCCLRSQVLPKEGSILNCRLVGFSFPVESGANQFHIEVASGRCDSEGSFKKNLVETIGCGSSEIVNEVPFFGTLYTWRVVYLKDQVVLKTGPFHHFSTLANARVDTAKLRLRIMKTAESRRDGYIAADAGGVFYDFDGRPICFLADTNALGGYVADMKFTAQGTVTFIYQRDAYEVTLNGDILWKAPNKGLVSGDTAKGEIYHHEFTRLPNGHYMILGTELLMCKPVTTGDTSYILVFDKARAGAGAGMEKITEEGFDRAMFGTLIEYDEKGKILWVWKSSKHYLGSDFDYFTAPEIHSRLDPHDNTFLFDEQNNCIYLGSRNLNRILKIEYPTGRVLSSYGASFKPGEKGNNDGLFCHLHSIKRSKDGYLYFFNNNSCLNTDSMPAIVVLQEAPVNNGNFKKIWEYKCSVEDGAPKKYASGGNVLELSDGSFFVNMGSDYSKCFIVNKAKQVLWSALPERFVETDGKWVPVKEDRVNVISREKMELLVWSAEKYLK